MNNALKEQWENIKESMNKNIEDARVAEIKRTFSLIKCGLAINDALPEKQETNKRFVDDIKKRAKTNNICLRKIPVNYFGKTKAHKALKLFAKQESKKTDENFELLDSIEEYLIENGKLKNQKK